MRKDSMSRTFPALRRKAHGFTLIELLVCLLILVILLAIALPLYLSSISDAQYKVCRSNMQTIANAVQAARVRTMAPNYGTWVGSRVADLISDNRLPDLQISPICPNGSYFAIDVGSSGTDSTFKVKCCPLHGSYEPGVNSN